MLFRLVLVEVSRSAVKPKCINKNCRSPPKMSNIHKFSINNTKIHIATVI